MKPYLTPRQEELARLISLGCTNEEMADILDLAVNTIDNNRVRLYETLGTDKAQLVARLAITSRWSFIKDKLIRNEKCQCGIKQDGYRP